MALALATTVAFCLWIVLWAVGVGGFDSLLLSSMIILLVAGARALGRFAPTGRRGPGRVSAPQGGW